MKESPRFTLRPGRWYAAELIGDEFGEGLRSYSPIRVDSVRSFGTGQRRLDLAFYHANYPEGVREKVYSLQTLERSTHFLLTRSVDRTPVRLLLIYDVSWTWLRAHFRIEPPANAGDITDWLSSQT